MNNKYRIQNYFKDFDRTELFFTNPTSKNIKFTVNNSLHFLKKGCSKIVELKNCWVKLNNFSWENVEFKLCIFGDFDQKKYRVKLHNLLEKLWGINPAFVAQKCHKNNSFPDS